MSLFVSTPSVPSGQEKHLLSQRLHNVLSDVGDHYYY